MNTRSTKKLVREGDLVAEVEVNVVEAEGRWAPYLSLDARTSSMTCGTLCGRVT